MDYYQKISKATQEIKDPINESNIKVKFYTELTEGKIVGSIV